MTDPGLILVADVHGLAGRAPELRTLLDDLAANGRREPGCVDFRALDAEDPGAFVVLASWTDEAALRDHYATVHYRRYREQVGELLARPSDVLVHHVRATIHARDPGQPDPGLLG